MGRAAELIKNTEVFDSKSETDTIRLWESYREQALFWRAMALMQMPATMLAMVLALFMWLTRSVTLNVPAKPLPGFIKTSEIPDEEFIDMATRYINLIATYQPAVARPQYNKAREMIKANMLERFDAEMLTEELKAIETTYRTQTFFIDPSFTSKPSRKNGEVTVTLEGDRVKTIGGKELPAVKTRFLVTMTTIPKNDLNPYGIVISNVTNEVVNPLPEERERSVR